MPESGELTPGTDRLDDRTANEFVSLAGGLTEDELAGPDRGLEHSALYATIFLLLVGGAMLLSREGAWLSSPASHTLMEVVAMILAFIIGGLSLVRYYSRKQATFLLIGCGFLGAALFDLNHVITTTPFMIEVREVADDRVQAVGLYAWTWTAERVFLSLFIFVSFLAWRQEAKEVRGEKEAADIEKSVYVFAVLGTVINMLFFELTSVGSPTALGFVARPGEFVPAAFFGMAFVGYYRKGSWRRDQFDHWMLVFLLISVLMHAAFMAFSVGRFDAMFDAAHLLKITSYGAILAGLMSSVYVTFARESTVLGALRQSNDALAREVDFRSKTEAAVIESSARLQRFLDNANDLIQSVGPDGSFLYVNSAWKRVLGYEDEDLDRTTLFEIVHPLHRASLEEELARVLGGGDPRRFNVEYLAADGRVVILSGSTQAQLVGGQSVATQSILRDVTEQRLAERQLDESQRNLEALVENTGDSIWSVDRDHRLITLNSAFSLAVEARTGREPTTGELPAQVFAPEDVEWYESLYDRTLAGDRNVAVRSDDVDGHQRYFELYANPIHSLEGVSGAVFFGKDVTARERAEEALRIAKDEAEAANKAKSDFLANMSHELRTPLNSVIGFANILLKNKGERLIEKELGFLQRILSNGKHLLALINEVLDLAKVEAGRMELIIEEIDLAHLCSETVQQLEGQAKAKDGQIGLFADVPESVELVETDSAKLKQVIINLVGNALKFTHEGSVTVRLDMAPDGRTPVAISVVDTGIGIPEDRLTAIFEAFQQAEAGTSRKYGGTGLGLALSRSICLLMGYDLMVESELGKGSVFRIVMGARPERAMPDQEGVKAISGEVDNTPPARPTVGAGKDTPKAAASTPGPQSALAPTNGSGTSTEVTDAAGAGPGSAKGGAAVALKPGPGLRSADDMVDRPSWGDFKVLCVDDETDSRVLIAHFLKDFGCQVFTADGGVAGLELAREHVPDLITLDLLMPDLTGWEVLRRLKADPDLRHIPVVVVSVVANEGRGKLLGAVDLVTKPFDREDLLRVLWRNLGRRRGGRVLLMVSDEARRRALSDVITDRGLEVATARSGDLIAVLGKEAPDAVVMDLMIPGLHGVAALLELRDDRVHTGLPVLALTHGGLNERERELVGELATVHADVEGSAVALRRLLDASFPLAVATDSDV